MYHVFPSCSCCHDARQIDPYVVSFLHLIQCYIFMFLVNHIIDLLDMAILVPRQPVKLTVTNQGVVEGYGVRAAHEIPSRTLVLKFTGKSYSTKEEAESDRISVRSKGLCIIFRTSKGGGRWIVPDRQCQARYLNTSADKVILCNNYLHFRTIHSFII